MRVFLTGASGFVGSAIVPELIAAGHRVLGLARSDASAAKLTAAGADVHRGDLKDLDSLRRGAEASDGVIHCAFIHDFSDFAGSCETDRLAIEAIGGALAGSDRPLIVTSGTGLLAPGRLATEDESVAPGRLATEDDLVDPESAGSPRAASEVLTMAMTSRGVRTSLMRLPPSVHGDGDHHGFVPILIDIARKKGVSAYIGDGANRWPAVHRLDAARLYKLALEKAPAGSRLHAVADEGVPTRDIAAVIGRRLDLPVVAISAEEAGGHFGWFGHFFSRGVPASSALTRERMRWHPEHPALLPDLDQGHYFEG